MSGKCVKSCERSIHHSLQVASVFSTVRSLMSFGTYNLLQPVRGLGSLVHKRTVTVYIQILFWQVFFTLRGHIVAYVGPITSS